MHLYTKLKIAWVIVFIFLVAASLSKSTASAHQFGIDLFFHIIFYGVLSAVPIITIHKRITAFMITIAIAPLGILFEILHGMTTGYGFENLDAFYNNVGIIIGIISASLLRMKKHYEQKAKMEK